jgi:predicted RNase H-like HicB family nuclease
MVPAVAESGGEGVLTYKAMYKFLDEGVHAEVLDFPGVITCGGNLDEARRLLASALVDMAETNLLAGEPLPLPDPTRMDPDADIEEPIYLLLKAASRVQVVAEDAVA